MRFRAVCLAPFAPLGYVAGVCYGLWQRRRDLWVSYGLTCLVVYHHTILSLERAFIAVVCCALGLAVGWMVGVWWDTPALEPVVGRTSVPCHAPVNDPASSFTTATLMVDSRGFLTAVCP
jgi:hypothetical protein